MGQCHSNQKNTNNEYDQCDQNNQNNQNNKLKKQIHYPEHEPRKNTSLYNHTHRELCIKNDTPCFICNKTRKDNIVTETHHFFCEYAGMNGIDWIEFGQRAKCLYNPQTGKNFAELFDWKQVQKDPSIFVDSQYNMIVLCVEHHRSSNRGIHHVPFPEWFLQVAPKNGFVFIN
jgi:hypothetical protein